MLFKWNNHHSFKITYYKWKTSACRGRSRYCSEDLTTWKKPWIKTIKCKINWDWKGSVFIMMVFWYWFLLKKFEHETSLDLSFCSNHQLYFLLLVFGYVCIYSMEAMKELLEIPCLKSNTTTLASPWKNQQNYETLFIPR